MITYTTGQALGQARLADLRDQARRDALARAARRARRARRQHAPHRATALQAALTRARVPRRKTTVGTPGRVMSDG
jgi:hypothetical protein